MQYLATYSNGKTRRIRANHVSHAWQKARGVGRSNGWVVLSVGQI